MTGGESIWERAEALWRELAEGLEPVTDRGAAAALEAARTGRLLVGDFARFGLAGGEVRFACGDEAALRATPRERLVVLRRPIGDDEIALLNQNLWEHLDEVPGWPWRR